MYLKRSPMILIKMLTNIINHNFKKKEEKIFLCHRLDLLDKHYYLQVYQQLWQSYFDIGIQQHRWPVSFSFSMSLLRIIFYYIKKESIVCNGKDK